MEDAIRHALYRSARPSPGERARAAYARLRGTEPHHDPARCRSKILFSRYPTDAALTVLRGERLKGRRAGDLRYAVRGPVRAARSFFE